MTPLPGNISLMYIAQCRYGVNISRRNVEPIPVSVPSKSQVCCRSLAGIMGSNPVGIMADMYRSLRWVRTLAHKSQNLMCVCVGCVCVCVTETEQVPQ